MKKSSEKQPSVVGLFSGCGGLDLGFRHAGFDILWANDFNADSVKTYARNIGDHIVLGDITKYQVRKYHQTLTYF